MNQYYLMAQLPSLDGISDSTPLPITEERFYELCNQFLSKNALKSLKELTLVPKREQEAAGSSLIGLWNDGERQLRLALASVRANKMKKSFDVGTDTFSAQVLQTARMAVEMDDPLEAEQYLNRFRLEFLETIRPMDTFSEDAVFYYGLKLKLIMRIRKFDTDKGQNAYRNIYDSIMSGGEQEVEE